MRMRSLFSGLSGENDRVIKKEHDAFIAQEIPEEYRRPIDTNQLKSHYQVCEHDPLNDDLACPVCDKACKNRQALRDHRQTCKRKRRVRRKKRRVVEDVEEEEEDVDVEDDVEEKEEEAPRKKKKKKKAETKDDGVRSLTSLDTWMAAKEARELAARLAAAAARRKNE